VGHRPSSGFPSTLNGVSRTNERNHAPEILGLAGRGGSKGGGANLPQEAIYPLNLGDEERRTLGGTNKYVLHFEKRYDHRRWTRSGLPRSMTRKDSGVANSLNRFAVVSWMRFNYMARSISYFQNESLDKDEEANWLPAPKVASI
jgi:hypothetical protein